MNADRAVRWATVLAVVAVAGVAAYVSYWHAVDVVTRLGEHGTIGHLYPVAIDGIIVAASMVLLDAARHSEASPGLAWALLAAGIGVTLAANVTYGAQSGLSSALWSAWPALAFVGCYELLMLLVRASARRAGAGDPASPPPPGPVPAPVPSDAQDAALMALKATAAAGNPLSGRQLETRFGITRGEATRLRTSVLAQANGHDPSDTEGR